MNSVHENLLCCDHIEFESILELHNLAKSVYICWASLAYFRIITFSEQLHQSVQNSYLFCKKKHIFSILHTHFYKIPTLVYLFYNLFYLNNNIS